MKLKFILSIVGLFAVLISHAQVDSKSNQDQLKTAKKVVNFIKSKKYKQILNAFPKEIASTIPNKTLEYYVDLGAKYISEDGIPDDDALMTKATMMVTKEGPKLITSITFPFPAPKQKYTMPKRIIEISFMEKYGNLKIASFNVMEYAAISNLTTESAVFLDSLNFGLDSISNWRIYYSKGNIINKNKPVFAVSGTKDSIKTLGLTNDFNSIFHSLKNAEIAEKTILNDIIRYNGKPENISLRWQFKGSGTFYRISLILTEEVDQKEDLNAYIVVSTSVFANENTIYKIKKSDANKIVEILSQFSVKDWGSNYEERP